jgi:hypothetical protein
MYREILTIIGGFILPFAIIQVWGRMVSRWKVVGGFLSAFLIVGPIWLMNHGITFSLIHQTGGAFVDMGLATGVGIFVYGLLGGKSFQKSLYLLSAALRGGLIAGILLYLANK